MINLDDGYFIQPNGDSYTLARYTGKSNLDKRSGKEVQTSTDATYHGTILSALATYRKKVNIKLIENEQLSLQEYINKIEELDKKFYDMFLSKIDNETVIAVKKELSERLG